MTNLIAFTGPAGSGKSTAARHLVEHHGFVLVKFAGPLKAMLRAIGFGDAEIEGHLKEWPHPLLQGKTPRHAMQTLGTEWGRDCMGPAFWVDLWAHAVRDVLEVGGRVVCDDCRFTNEAAAVREMGGKIVRLTGRGGIAGGHSSEAGGWLADMTVANDNDPAALYGRVDEIARRAA